MESLGPKETAAILRRLLRAAFPAVKFSVVTERGSMVSSVRIAWTDGPTAKRVEEIAGRFEAGHFDGMTDSYDYAAKQDRAIEVDGTMYHASTRYVFCSRKLSDGEAGRLAALLLAPFPVPDMDGWRMSADRGHAGGYLDLWQCIWTAAGDREKFERARFDALAWRACRAGERQYADGYSLPAQTA